MGLTLRSDLRLEPRESEGYVALYRPGRRQPRAPVFRLHPFQGLILALLDGAREGREVREIAGQVMACAPALAAEMYEAVVGRYRQFLVEKPASARSTAPRDDELADFLFSTDYDFMTSREAAPSAILWVVTEYCDKRCRYCYKDAIFVEDHRAGDLGLPLERFREIIDEAAEIGVNRVILSGGEPFLHPDIVDIIDHLVKRRMDVIPITKYRIDGERMAALAATGLEKLHVSLDSHRPETVDRLVGLRGSFDQMVDTIEAGVDHGIDIVLRPVLTSDNVDDLEGLVGLAVELGAVRVLIAVYGASCGRHEDFLRVDRGDETRIRHRLREFQERYRQAPIELAFDDPTVPADVGRGCVEGMKGITMLPDGKVTKCEHWRFGDELIYGDLARESIMSAWSSPLLQRINFPRKGEYEGTICFHCKNLEACDYLRGRCSLSSLVEYGNYAAPDCYCPIGAFEHHLETEKPRSVAAPPPPRVQEAPSRGLVQLGKGGPVAAAARR